MERMYELMSSTIENSKVGRPVRVLLNPQANLIEKGTQWEPYQIDPLSNLSLNILSK